MSEEEVREIIKEELLIVLKFINTLQDAVIDLQKRVRELEGDDQ